jgi:hypothetical protein
MAGRRQVWAGFTLLATSILVWSLTSGIAGAGAGGLSTPSSLAGATLVASALVLALRAVSGLAVPVLRQSSSALMAGRRDQQPPPTIRWSAPDAPGRPRPRAPGRRPTAARPD